MLPAEAGLAQAGGLPSLRDAALPAEALEGRAGAGGVVPVVAQGPAVALRAPAGVRGPHRHARPVAAAVGGGEGEAGRRAQWLSSPPARPAHADISPRVRVAGHRGAESKPR